MVYDITKDFKLNSENDLFTIIKQYPETGSAQSINITLETPLKVYCDLSDYGYNDWHYEYTIVSYSGHTNPPTTARMGAYLFDLSVSTTQYFGGIVSNYGGIGSIFTSHYEQGNLQWQNWTGAFTDIGWRTPEKVIGGFSCMPLFRTKTEAETWVNTGQGLENALNCYEPETEPEGVEYTIYNTGQRGTWSVGDVVTDVSTPFYRWARVKLASTDTVDGRLAFYKVGLDDDIIKLKPVSVADVVYCEYSTDGGANWQESDTFPYQYIYGERTNELGTFTYATRSGIGGASGVPVFEDETTATAWVNHDENVSITDALNYEDIASRYKYTNKTGDNETSTTMGTASGFRSHFTQKYLLDRGDVSVIANALFDTTTTIFEDIKKGLEMFGERIIDSICSLTYYPIDLTTVFTQLQSQSYIFFGGYQFQPENFNVNKLVGYSGHIDLGSFTIEPTFPNIEDARNYSPFCRVSIFLPYCGMFELDYNRVVGKTILVRYYIDINTGGCLVCLFESGSGGTQGKLITYMNGQIGSQIPITITDYAGYASAELRNISNLAGVGVNMIGGGIGVHSGVQAMQQATSQRAVERAGGEIGKGILQVAQAPVDFAKSMYDLSTTSISQFNSTKGSSGALGNQYLPQYVYLVFEYVRTEETTNLLQLEGKPSNKSGTVGSFSGYLEVDSVQLQCSGATENEKRSIINMLNSGIII